MGRADVSFALYVFALDHLRSDWAAARLAQRLHVEGMRSQPGGTNDRLLHAPMRLLPIVNRLRAKMGTGKGLRPRAQWPRSKLPTLPL
jgi:hypothetical protein